MLNVKPVAVSKQLRENFPVPITKASHYSNLGGDNMAMTNLIPCCFQENDLTAHAHVSFSARAEIPFRLPYFLK